MMTVELFFLLLLAAFAGGFALGAFGPPGASQRGYDLGYRDGRANLGPRSIGGIH